MKNFIKKANLLFQEQKFEQALYAYMDFCKKYPEHQRIVEFNIKLINSKLPKQGERAIFFNKDINNVLASVIVPAHNVENYIRPCLESICSQTHKNIEIIVVNDGSTDATLSILEECRFQDGRIKIINNLKASGNSGTPRNQAILSAKGDYIFFVDADDWIESNMIESHLREAIKWGADISTASGFRRSSDEFKNVETIQLKNFYRLSNSVSEIDDMFKLAQFPIVWYRCYKRDLIIDNCIFFAETKTAADIPFAVKALFFANKIVPVDGIFYNYRFDRPGSTIERRKGLGAFSLFESYQEIFNFIKVVRNPSDPLNQIIFNKFLGDCFYNLKLLSSEFVSNFKKQAFLTLKNNFDNEEIEAMSRGLSDFWMRFFKEMKGANV